MADEPITLGGVEVIDAHVDWNINYSNTPTFTVHLETEIDTDNFLPLTGEPTEDGLYIAEYDGVFKAFRPVDIGIGNRRKVEVQHENGETIEGGWDYHHNTKRHVNNNVLNNADDDVFGVTVKGRYNTSYAVRASKMHEIMGAFLNGSQGSEEVSYWCWYRDKNNKWRRATSSREDFEGYVSPEIVMVRDRTYGWKPVRVEDVTEQDTVYDAD